MSGESNKYVESNGYEEVASNVELNLQYEEDLANEFVSSTEINENTVSVSKAKIVSKASMLAITAVLAVVVSITVLLNNSSNFIVSFNKLEVYGKSISYDMNLEFDYVVGENQEVDFEAVDTGVRLILVNSKTNIIIPLKFSDDLISEVSLNYDEKNMVYKVFYNFIGEIKGLQEGTFYQLEVIHDDNGETKKLYSEKVKTLGGLKTVLNGVNFKCTCCIDGNASFVIDYVDENNFYSNFKYSLIKVDNDKIGIFDVQITNPKDRIVIQNVANLPGQDYILVLKYDSTAYSDTNDETGKEKILVENTIKVKL